MNVDTINNKRAAIAAVRAEADALIEQMTRKARGFDRGMWRDDVRAVDRTPSNTIWRTVRDSVAFAFALSARFADRAAPVDAVPDRAAPVDAVPDEVAALVAAGVLSPAALPGLPAGVAAFTFAPIDASRVDPIARLIGAAQFVVDGRRHCDTATVRGRMEFMRRVGILADALKGAQS